MSADRCCIVGRTSEDYPKINYELSGHRLSLPLRHRLNYLISQVGAEWV